MAKWKALLLGAAALPATAASGQGPGEVYAICTVRDVTVAGDRVIGKIYRSAIFAAPQTYDSDISLTPDKAGEVSGRFEKWVYSTYGLRSDRVSIGLGDEHYCIEAPATSDGERKLVALVQQWSSQPFPGIESVLTPWYPEGIGRKVAHLVPPSPEQQANYKAAVQKREADIAAMESAHRRAASDAKAALNQHAAEVARAAESRRQYELQRQTYREEYKSVTGRYPDE